MCLLCTHVYAINSLKSTHTHVYSLLMPHMKKHIVIVVSKRYLRYEPTRHFVHAQTLLSTRAHSLCSLLVYAHVHEHTFAHALSSTRTHVYSLPELHEANCCREQATRIRAIFLQSRIGRLIFSLYLVTTTKHPNTQAHMHTSTLAHKHTSTQAHCHTSTLAHKHTAHNHPHSHLLFFFQMSLTPIETSTEIIEGRVNALKNEVESPNTSTKTLQIVLQGSVLLRKLLFFVESLTSHFFAGFYMHTSTSICTQAHSHSA